MLLFLSLFVMPGSHWMRKHSKVAQKPAPLLTDGVVHTMGTVRRGPPQKALTVQRIL